MECSGTIKRASRLNKESAVEGENSKSLADHHRMGRRRFLHATLWVAAVASAELIAPAAFASGHPHSEPRKAAAPPPRANQSDGLLDPYTTACVMEPVTRTVIFNKDMDRPWPTASLAKMMVMLIVAEKVSDGSLKLDSEVTTSAAASKMGGSQVYLAEGETFTLDDMMKAVVVHSANDATYAVAEYVGGSPEAFVGLMNDKAAELGLKETHFYSVHGLPPENGEGEDVSSAYDLAIIGTELVQYPDVLRWSSIDTAPFRDGKFELRNTNHLVRTYAGCDGLKTGFYDKAGFNVVATARRDGLRLIAVVLGSPRKDENFDQAATMMSQGFLHYQIRQLAQKGAPIDRTVKVKGGAVSTITPVWDADAAVLEPRDGTKTDPSISYQLPESITAPILGGTRVGTARITVNGKPQPDIALIAPADVAQSSWIWRMIDRVY
ncbi:MAG: D-alanyl-D-alanine carboxypeptidase family protein [Candidatus Binataceae bacterium]